MPENRSEVKNKKAPASAQKQAVPVKKAPAAKHKPKTVNKTPSSKKKPATDKYSKQVWKPGNMVYPLPAVMVSCAAEGKKPNIITVGWTGTVCSDPALVYISVRHERYSYDIIRESGEFVINLTTEELAFATDYCGVKSGRDCDKFADCRLTPMKASVVSCPIIAQSPVNIECKVKKMIPLGTHDMFLAEVVAIDVSEDHLDDTGRFKLNEAGLLAYIHGEYHAIGKKLGSFGYSVRRKKPT